MLALAIGLRCLSPVKLLLITLFPVLLQLAFAQDNTEFRLSWACVAPQERVLCLQPSGLVQWSLEYRGSSAQPGLALGGRLQAQTHWQDLEVWADLGLWYDAAVQFGLLEAFVTMNLGEFALSLGKRRDYSGPWDDTLMGRDGRWGVFTRYNPTEAPWLGLELAYLPNAGWAGGQGFVGGRADIFQVGTFVEVVQVPNGLGEPEPSIRLVPRLGLQGREVGLFWQWDRGLWSTLSLPLPLGQTLAFVLQCPCDADTQAWLEVLDKSRFEGLLWWNPDWEYLGENSLFLPEERLEAWLQVPRKLLLGVAYSWNDQFRLAVDFSRAPVEAVRVYVQLHWR